MELESEILLDYGNIPQKIGLFLLTNDSSPLNDIAKSLEESASLSFAEVCNGLAILIQRRIVSYFIFGRVVRYKINRNILLRRLYFPLYLKHISENCSKEQTEAFTKVLLQGTLKEEKDTSSIIEELLLKGYLMADSYAKDKESLIDEPRKQLRTSASFVVVNYTHIDQHIFEMRVIRYISVHLNEAAADVMKALLRSHKATKKSILENLSSKKIWVVENDAIVNSKDNIDEYLLYLLHSGVILCGMEGEPTYFFNHSPDKFKRHIISTLISLKENRRLFNLVSLKNPIPDTDLTFLSLLSLGKIKNGLIQLQKNGLVVQICLGDYRQTSRIEHALGIDMVYLSASMRKNIESHITDRLRKFNECWLGNYYPEDRHEDGAVWISDIIGMSCDHLLFGL